MDRITLSQTSEMDVSSSPAVKRPHPEVIILSSDSEMEDDTLPVKRRRIDSDSGIASLSTLAIAAAFVWARSSTVTACGSCCRIVYVPSLSAHLSLAARAY